VTEREVRFYSEDVPLKGTLTTPRARKRSRLPAVVLVHGYGSFRDELTGFKELAGKFADSGIATLRFDMRGCGESGERGMILPHLEWVTDVLSAVTYLQSLNGIDHRRIGLVGMSVGGGVVCYAAAIDRRINCVVALAPVADGEWWLEHLWISRQGKRAWKEFLEKLDEDRKRRVLTGKSKKVPIGQILAFRKEEESARKKLLAEYPQLATHVYLSSADSLIAFKPIRFVHMIAPRPIRFVHSADDESVPVKHSYELYGAAGEVKDLQVIRRTPHCFWLSFQSERVQNMAVEWMVEHL